MDIEEIDSIIQRLMEMEEKFEFGAECKIQIAGNSTFLYCEKRAAIQIARRLLQMSKSVPGSHFTIDIADIAIDETGSVTFSLTDNVDSI